MIRKINRKPTAPGEILHEDYRVFASRPECIPFLAAGELFWEDAQEESILELLLD